MSAFHRMDSNMWECRSSKACPSIPTSDRARNARAPPSPRSTGFCAIRDYISTVFTALRMARCLPSCPPPLSPFWWVPMGSFRGTSSASSLTWEPKARAILRASDAATERSNRKGPSPVLGRVSLREAARVRLRTLQAVTSSPQANHARYNAWHQVGNVRDQGQNRVHPSSLAFR